jgi:hypothetical protein
VKDLVNIGAGIEDEESHIYLQASGAPGDTPYKRGSGSRGSMQDSKRPSAKNLNTGGTGSRQSL